MLILFQEGYHFQISMFRLAETLPKVPAGLREHKFNWKGFYGIPCLEDHPS